MDSQSAVWFCYDLDGEEMEEGRVGTGTGNSVCMWLLSFTWTMEPALAGQLQMLNAFAPEICADFVVMLTMLSLSLTLYPPLSLLSVPGIAVRHQAKILQRTVSDRLKAAEEESESEGESERRSHWKTQKSLMKIACKWFLFLPACHVMVARFACKTFGLLSARHTHPNTHTHMRWLCAKTAKAKSLPRTWTWKSRLP